MDYRWERASGGEIPSGAWAQGHGWEWRDTDDGQEQEPLWVARSLPHADAGSVRLGFARRGQGAYLGGQRQPVGDYEVLLDEGRWAAGDWVHPESDDCYIEIAGVGGVACGHATDGAPLYVTLRDREGEGLEPSESAARTDCGWARQVLLAPVETPAAGEPAPAPAAQQPADAGASAAAAPKAVISVLDCKNELVEITNTGADTLDLSSWKLHDESSRKGYVFPAGTILASGASLRVRSGAGAKTPAAGELAWKTASVWNDKGDTAYLEDPAGAVVASKKG
jgi:Lamin Tail Domain